MTQQVGFGGFSIRELEQKLAGTKLFTYFERDSRYESGNLAAAWLRHSTMDESSAESELKILLKSITKPHPNSGSSALVFRDSLYLDFARTSDGLKIEAESSEWAQWDDSRFEALIELDQRLVAAGFIALTVPKNFPFRPFTRTGT